MSFAGQSIGSLASDKSSKNQGGEEEAMWLQAEVSRVAEEGIGRNSST
jgi:hypothetical protein